MKRRNAQKIGEAFGEFFKSNPELYKRILEYRVQKAWNEVLGAYIAQYTRSVYVHSGVLYVSLSSSVLRNELMLSRDRLIVSLNEYAGADVIRDIVMR